MYYKNYLLLICLFIYIPLHAQWVEMPSGETGKLDALHFFDENNGLCSGGFTDILKTTDGGTTWTSIGGIATRDFSFLADDDDIGFGAATVVSSMHKSNDGGDSWTSITPPTSNSLWCVAALGPLTAIWGGTGNVIWKTTNGGATVTVEDDGFEASTTITDLVFTSSTIGYAVGQTGIIKKTINAGESWTTIFTIETGSFSEMHFVDENIGFVAGSGGKVYKTIDAGDSWVEIATGSASALQGIHFYDALHGITVGYSGTILYTTDGGDTWTDSDAGTSTNLFDVRLTSPTSAIICGEDGLILKNDELVSIDELTITANIKLFPNPFQDQFSIIAEDNIMSIKVTDLQGKIVHQDFSLNSGQKIDLNLDVECGTYVVYITTDRGTATKKIVKV